MAKHQLSKSTFMYGVQCPLRLYLHKFKPELKNPVDEEEAIFATGTNVGLLAQSVFPGGVDVTPPDAYSYPISATKTLEAIKQGVKIIWSETKNAGVVLLLVASFARFFLFPHDPVFRCRRTRDRTGKG